MTKISANTKQLRTKPGPAPDILKIDGDWVPAAARLVQVKKPARGWPKPETNRKPRTVKKSAKKKAKKAS